MHKDYRCGDGSLRSKERSSKLKKIEEIVQINSHSKLLYKHGSLIATIKLIL